MKVVNSGKVEYTSKPNMNRSDMEYTIATNSKDFWSKQLLSDLINLPTVKCTYYSVNANMTTYGNSTKESKVNVNTLRFDKINNMTLINREGQDIDDQQQQDRALNIHLAPKTSIILYETQVIPKENDHIILSYQAFDNVHYPYRVTKVTPALLAQKEAFIIEYSQSNLFKSQQELDNNVVSEKDFIDRTLGSGNQTLFNKGQADQIEKITAIYDRLSKSFTDLFYDDEKDLCAYKYKFRETVYQQDPSPDTIWFLYGALVKFQETEEILKYGFYRNTLFIGSAYQIPREEANYNNSLFVKLMDKEFCKVDPDYIYVDNIDGLEMKAFKNGLDERDLYNEEHGINYVAKYDYTTKLYFMSMKNHSMLSRFYLSKIITTNMIETPDASDGMTRSSHIYYTLKSPTITRILDCYMDDNQEKLIEYILKLKRYSIDKENIDDYMGIPLLLFVIRYVLDSLSGKMRETYY